MGWTLHVMDQAALAALDRYLLGPRTRQELCVIAFNGTGWRYLELMRERERMGCEGAD